MLTLFSPMYDEKYRALRGEIVAMMIMGLTSNELCGAGTSWSCFGGGGCAATVTEAVYETKRRWERKWEPRTMKITAEYEMST